MKPATTNTTSFFGTASWQRSPTSPAVVASIRTGTRGNDLARGEEGALDELNLGLTLSLGIPVDVFEGISTRINLNLSTVSRDDPANPTAESRDRYYLAGVQSETLDRASTLTLMYGLNTSELLGIPNAKTDFHRLVGNARYLGAPRWAATLDGTWTGARSPDEADAFGLRYNRAELLGGAEFKWTAASSVTLLAWVIDYNDQLNGTQNTMEIVVRMRLHRAF